MNRTRTVGAAVVVLAGIIVCGVAFAQAPASPPTTSPAPAASASTSTKPFLAVQVEAWTRKRWEAARKKWATNKAKWADCRKQSSTRKLEGGKRWSFLYKCTTR